MFFRGAGVSNAMTSDIAARLKVAPKDVNKYEMARAVLERLNAKGEAALRERREVLRRVVEFSNFDACWASDQLKAKGLVASIREIVNQKDAFTRMNNAREEERRARLTEAHRAAAEKRARTEKIEAARQELYSLLGMVTTAQDRGRELEAAMNNLFQGYGVLVRKAFHLVGDAGEGIVEQIDGIIELGGVLYFVEMKWYRNPVGKPEISEHVVRLMSRAEVRGIFISAGDYTEPAIRIVREFLQHKVLILSTLQEVVRLLEQPDDLEEFLTKKVQAAQIHKNPYFQPYGG
ncbi:restriction endonuclease [Burkholderia multivorans]|uniref:restriction endonuclease n=2 Tax=Burkholderia multivorans TaxID=87883 RepID=UPI001E4825EB|nr:restriction endonuclease [Burkholderia multivorans]MCA8488083.1 restriction endonuclease [Burkholderia multivorans]